MRMLKCQSSFRKLATIGLLLVGGIAWSKALPAAEPTRESILSAAKKLATAYPFCALVTINADGGPSIRTMNPLPIEDEMTVWFATTDRGRKYQEMLKDPRVTVYFSNHQKAEGYVAVYGKASLIKDPSEIQKRKRGYWDKSFPGLKNLVLIKIVPQRLEVVSYKDNLHGDPETFRPATLDFGGH